MGVLARGSVTDRPWGMTLGALGMRGLTGQLTLANQYRVAFDQGAVVGAYSPLANDAAVRLALTGNLITSSQVNDITRRIAAAPLRDEVEVLAEACRLQPEQAQRLRRRLVAQRAARTFAIDQGEFVVEDQVTVAVVPGSALDVRVVVYLGAKNNLREDRLAAELGQLGVWFRLKPEAIEDLPQYGFSEDDKPVLQLLVQGANLVDIELANVVLGARAIRAITYALAVCGACDASATAGPSLPRSPSTTMALQSSLETSPHATTPPPRTHTTTPPRMRTTTTPPDNVQRAAPNEPSTTSPPETKQHKTAPLGSRSPSAGSNPPRTQPTPGRVPTHDAAPAPGRVPTHDAAPAPGRVPTHDAAPAPGRVPTRDAGAVDSQSTARQIGQPASEQPRAPSAPAYGGLNVDPANGRVPTPQDVPQGPRTITQSSGVPRETESRNSSGATSAARTGSFGAVRGQDRSPSSGVRAADRSPSSGVRASDRSPSSGVRASDRSPSAGYPRPRSASQTQSPPLTPRTRTASSGPGLRPPADGAERPRTSSSGPMRQYTTQSPPLRAPAKLPNRRAKQSTAATLEIEALLMKKIPMLDQGVDYFTLFGLPIGAPPDAVRSTYFMLARKLHPDRLSAIGIDDEDRQAQRLMACINEAFAILNDPIRRGEYVAVLGRGGEAAVRAEDQKADEMAMRVMRAEEEFRQGEMALRREQIPLAITHFQMAVELQPNEAEYQALLAWAQFANAADKSTVASHTRRTLIRAAEKNSESPTAHFYLGRVERMLGREKEALYCFYQVLKIKPNHSEARSEARILEQRLKGRK
jgi:hypothetical protein